MTTYLTRPLSLLALILLFTNCNAQTLNYRVENNYNNWGWDNVLIAENDYIRLSVVPEAGGRMMEFNLGNTPSLWINPSYFGKSFAPNERLNGLGDWRNFGGYRLVPIPINNVALGANNQKTSRWPPPARIGENPYTGSIQEIDSKKSIHVISGIQELPVPKLQNGSYTTPSTVDERLQYERNMSIEKGKSLLHITHKLHNKGTNSVSRGLKITSQQTSRSEANLTDGENFLAYIPIDKSLKINGDNYFKIGTTPQQRWNFVHRNRMPLNASNPDHIEKYFNTGTNWTGEVAPGIFELHYDYYLMTGFHIISAKSWICFVDKTKMTAFAKMFEPYDNSKNYEFGLNMEIYNSGVDTGYLETEIKTPIYNIEGGENFSYTETQAAAKIASLPVLEVTKTGVTTEKLSFEISNKNITGKFGVFVAGKSVVRILDEQNQKLEDIEIENVSPLNAVIIDQTLNLNENAKSCELLIIDNEQNEYLLAKCSLTAATNSIAAYQTSSKYEVIPNPSSKNISIQKTSDAAQIEAFYLLDLNGKVVKKSDDENLNIDVSDLETGIYMVQLNTSLGSLIKKVIVN